MTAEGALTISARLGHGRELAGPPGQQQVEFVTAPFSVERPQSGTTTVDLVCATCKQPVKLEVASAPAVQRRRINNGLIAVGLAIFSMAVWTTVETGEITFLQAAFLFAAFFSAIGAVRLLISALGGKLALVLNLVGNSGPHKLFPPESSN